MKVVYLSGTRADYSLIRRALIELNFHVDLTILVTSMHLSPAFGSTFKEIEKDGFKTKKVDMLIDGDDIGAMVKSFGIGVYGIAQALEDMNPDLVLVEGDRGESLAMAIVAAHMNIPVVHHGGGDVSGSIDNKIRTAITIFSDYHLVGNEESYQRLRNLGISEKRLFIVGEPGLDDISAGDFSPRKEIIDKFNIDANEPLLVLIQHPDTEKHGNIELEIKEILNAIQQLQTQTIAIYANADAGGRKINENLESYSQKLPILSVTKNLSRMDFLGLLNICNAMVGNSSAGLVELPSFKKPFVCIGTRQKNRLRAENVIEVDTEKEQIVAGIKKALYDKQFREKLKTLKNPYGDGKTSIRIKEIILKILEDNK
ncbi:MAG: UDP-N-acetylglucosamine 2-epimerase [Candidatus Odinarchaeota archaeon]